MQPIKNILFRSLFFFLIMMGFISHAEAQTAAMPPTPSLSSSSSITSTPTITPTTSQTMPSSQPQVKTAGTADDKTKMADTKSSSNLPIEISADSLEVLQKENKAIFRGNVIAVQGDVRLKSDVMTVHYKQKGADAKTAPKSTAPTPTPATNAAAPGDMGAITSIDVVGNVLVVNPEETAKGDRGDYQVATRIIHLYGDNVILTRDKNILRGTALEYNMETGRSILTNGSDVVNSKDNKTRVRGVFIPKEDTKPANGKTPSKGDAKSSTPVSVITTQPSNTDSTAPAANTPQPATK